jgi:hypothetical protein
MALEEWTVKGDKSNSILYITTVEKFGKVLSYCTENDQLITDFKLDLFNGALLVPQAGKYTTIDRPLES